MTRRTGLPTLRRILLGDSASTRAASLLATATAGATFMPGLMPRGAREQAALTGIASALQHGLTMNAKARHHVAARVISSWLGRSDDATTVRTVETAIAGANSVAGLALYTCFTRAERPGVRTVGTLGLRLMRIGMASLVVAGADTVDERLGRRHPGVRALAPAAGVVTGGAIAARIIRRLAQEDPVVDARAGLATDPLTGERPRHGGRPERELSSVPATLALGLLISSGLTVLGGVQGALARKVADGTRRALPGSDPYASAVGHAVVTGTLVGALGAAMSHIYHRAEAGGAAIDTAYTTAPTSPSVSGGPSSGVDWRTLGREGVRFVANSLDVETISSIMEVPPESVRSPIRCFAGLESAETVGARVGLVMEDLEALGAFERSVICLTSPTGTGYLNYVALESLEYLTHGDCATVGLQYSLRPSYLSLDRVVMAREQNLALLNAIVWRLRAIPEEHRPRLVAFGESLGAQTLQSCFMHEGAAGLQRTRVDAALFVGTPAASRWAKDWRADPAREDPESLVVEVSDQRAWDSAVADGSVQPRYVLLSHHEDPIVKFTPLMAIRRPEWLPLRGPRPPGVPRTSVWLPYTTLLVGLCDIVNAIDVVPGVFVSRGHDYRADLARMVSNVYRLPASEGQMGRIEADLRRRERLYAQERDRAQRLRGVERRKEPSANGELNELNGHGATTSVDQ